MSRAPKQLMPAASSLHFFGAEIRRLRLEQGLSQEMLGQLLFQSKDLVRKIESAQRTPTLEFVSKCDTALGAGGALHQMWPLIERERRLRPIRSPDAPRSADALFRAQTLDRPVLDWLLAPTSSCPASKVMNLDAQSRLNHLRQIDHTEGARAVYPQLRLLLAQDLPDLSSRVPQVAIGYLELAGYEAVDVGADGQAQGHYLHALDIATRCGDHLYGGYLIAVSLAHLALHCGDTDSALRLATAGIHGTQGQATPAVEAAFHAVLARVRARRGEQALCLSALDHAQTRLAESDPAQEPTWISYFGLPDFADEKAHCYFDLHEHDASQAAAREAIETLDSTRIRRLVIDTSLYAGSLARTGEIDEACLIGRAATDHAARTGSFRSEHRIALLMATLHPYVDLPAVREFADYVRERLPAVSTLSVRRKG